MGSPSSLLCLTLSSRGDVTGFASLRRARVMRSFVCFCWFRNIPLPQVCISRPRNYVICPRSFIWNEVLMEFLMFWMPIESSPLIKISSTYTRSLIIPEEVRRINIEGSYLLCWNLANKMVLWKFSNHPWGPCFNPYNERRRRQTRSGSPNEEPDRFSVSHHVERHSSHPFGR